MLKANYDEVRQNIDEACKKVGRDPKEVTLICVSKTKPNEMIDELYMAGIRDFGENKVQELAGKMEALPTDINWHQIGHLQRNKVKYILGKTKLIHSVDSFRLAEEINIQAKRKGIVVPILIELNIGGEESKFGLDKEDAISFVEQVAQLDGLKIKGLMTVAPFVDDPEENRSLFKAVKDLSLEIDALKIKNVSMDELSMGMTNDYIVAVEEGATLVRVGTAIFGARNYNI